MNALDILTFLLIVTYVHCIPTIQDDTPFGITAEKNSEAYVEQNNKTLSYSFDISPLVQASYLLNEVNNICNKQPISIQSFELQIMDIGLWNHSKFEDTFNHTFYRPLSNIESLEINVNTFINHIGLGKCKLLPNISKNIYDINSDLIPLSKSNFSSIYNLISKSQLITDIKKVITGKLLENCTLQFDFDTNLSKFFESTTFKFGTHQNFLRLSFQIPIYTKKKQNVYKISSIPRKFYGAHYILRSHFSLLINDTEKLILFNNETFEKFCPCILESRFCRIPNKDDKDKHSFEVSSSFPLDVQDKFFIIKLPKQNTATKIGDNFYFSVFSPFELHVFCQQSNYSVFITKSVKIENNTACALKTPFFEFTPFIHDNGFVHITKWFNESKETLATKRNGESTTLYIYILCFIFLGFTFIIIVSLLLKTIP